MIRLECTKWVKSGPKYVESGRVFLKTVSLIDSFCNYMANPNKDYHNWSLSKKTKIKQS